MNEFIFLIFIIVLSCASLIALKLGKDFLIAFICVKFVLVNLFVSKQIELFTLHATAAEALAVGITLSFNLLQEYYGREEVHKAIKMSFFLGIVYLAISYLHIWYIPSASDTSQIHFEKILTPLPRLIAASFLVYVVVQRIDAVLYSFFQKLFKNRYFILRNYLSAGISQAIDTVLFSIIGLYGILSQLGEVMLVSFIIKCVIIALMAPFLSLSKIWMKRYNNHFKIQKLYRGNSD